MQYFRANPVSGGQLKLNSQRRPITSEKIFVISDLVSM
ncbi:shufflon protein C, partial [Escherichia coli]